MRSFDISGYHVFTASAEGLATRYLTPKHWDEARVLRSLAKALDAQRMVELSIADLRACLAGEPPTEK